MITQKEYLSKGEKFANLVLQYIDIKEPSPETVKFFERSKKLRKLIGNKDRYWHIYDPIDENDKNDPTEYFISGDLAEIYDDLMDGLYFWKMDDPIQKEEAILQWQISWDSHWGCYHALNALRAIHRHIEEFFIEYEGDDMDDLRNRYL